VRTGEFDFHRTFREDRNRIGHENGAGTFRRIDQASVLDRRSWTARARIVFSRDSITSSGSVTNSKSVATSSVVDIAGSVARQMGHRYQPYWRIAQAIHEAEQLVRNPADLLDQEIA
jgi:hypothetical protein